MLILSRRNGESFVIGDDIKITVLSQRSNQVRIGIDAPRSLPVHREEVLERRKAEAARVAGSEQDSSPQDHSSQSHDGTHTPTSFKATTDQKHSTAESK